MNDTCREIMIAHPTTILPSCTLLEALNIIREKRMRYLPVVDENKRFLGQFSSITCLSLLLPQSMNIHMGKLPPELNFMRTTLEELKEQLGELANNLVINHLMPESQNNICYPESSIMEAIHLLNEHHAHVIVVGKENKEFLGVITISGLLDHITS